MTPERVDLTGGCLVFRSLKSAVRASAGPFPPPRPTLFDHIDLVHRVREAQNIAGAFVTTYLGTPSAGTKRRNADSFGAVAGAG